jgi:hypothetical protein
LVEHETVPVGAEAARNIEGAGRQRGVGICPRLVFSRATDLDHHHVVGCFEHTMADGRRLQEAVALVHQHWFALILIGDAHPAAMAIDHLKAHVVEVHVVVHRSAVLDQNVRGDEAPAEAAWDQVAVTQAGAALTEAVAVLGPTRDHELLDQLRHLQRHLRGYELDDCSVGRG